MFDYEAVLLNCFNTGTGILKVHDVDQFLKKELGWSRKLPYVDFCSKKALYSTIL
jgi:hypothetical protein